MNKKVLFLSIIIYCVFNVCISSFAQIQRGCIVYDKLTLKILQDKDRARDYAYKNLNGVGITLNYRRAYKIFRILAESGDAEAFNALGMMYKYGTGLKQNDEAALALFTQSANRGYAKAAYNIGLMYKQGYAVQSILRSNTNADDSSEPDLEKAMEWFDKARELGYEQTDYMMGYAHYKGMGKKQSYAIAFQYFTKGANKGNALCMYHLSICYFRGRGVERNPELGKYWMEQAADKGFSRAIDVIARYDSKTYGEKTPRLRTAYNSSIYEMVPQKHVRVSNTVNDAANRNLSGEWAGELIQYDWSGEEIEKETKLKIIFDAEKNFMEGIWEEDDSLQTRISASRVDSVWIFNNIRLHESERPLDMRTGKFNIIHKDGKYYLTGNVTFFSETIREYTAPNYVILERQPQSPTHIDYQSENNQVIVVPNPFDEKITVKISINKPQKIRIVIYNLSGNEIYRSSILEYSTGTHQVDIPTASYPNGSYIVKVAGENINKSIPIIK